MSDQDLFLAAPINWFLESKRLAILPYPGLSAAATWVSDFLNLYLQICNSRELRACKTTDSTSCSWVGEWGGELGALDIRLLELSQRFCSSMKLKVLRATWLVFPHPYPCPHFHPHFHPPCHPHFHPSYLIEESLGSLLSTHM